MNGPYIVIEFGCPHVATQFPEIHPNRLAVMGRIWEQVHAFDQANHYVVQPREVRILGWWARFLAHTIYNPRVVIDFHWSTRSDCRREDIISLIKEGLLHDDDLIQQWFGADDILALLQSAQTWEELLLAVRAIGGEHECEPAVSRFVETALGSKP